MTVPQAIEPSAVDAGPDAGASTAERVYLALYAAIVRGELVPGQALSEAEVAARYHVSRQPVREAFIRLREAELVGIRPYRGTFVTRISPAAVREGQFVREAVEIAVLRALGGLHPRPDLDPLRRVLAAQAEVATGDDAAFMALDDAFHRGLCELAGHARAWAVIQRAKAQTDRVRYLSLAQATPIARLIAQHRAVVEALEIRDVPMAETAMRAHLSEIQTVLPGLHAAHPDLFEAPGLPAAVTPSDPKLGRDREATERRGRSGPSSPRQLE